MLLLWGRASHFLFVHPPKILSWREPLFISTSTSTQPPHSCAGRRKSKASSLVATREQLGNNRRPNKDPKLKKKLISWLIYRSPTQALAKKALDCWRAKEEGSEEWTETCVAPGRTELQPISIATLAVLIPLRVSMGKCTGKLSTSFKITPSWKSWCSWRCSDVAPYLVLRWTLPLGPFWCPPTLVNHLRNTHPRWSLS